MNLLIEFNAIIIIAAITILIMSIVHMSSFGGSTTIAVATRTTAAIALGAKLGRTPNVTTLHTLLDLVAIDGNMVCFPAMLAWLVSFGGRDK